MSKGLARQGLIKPQRLAKYSGYSHFEFILVLLIILALALVIIRVLSTYAIDDEQQKMESVIASLDQAMLQTYMEAQVKNREGDVIRLEGTNPMDLLRAAPKNYAGLRGEDEGPGEPGTWYFNYTNQELIYHVNHSDFFIGFEDSVPLARYKLLLNFTDNNTNNRYDVGSDKLHGLKLQAMADYRWLN